MLATAQWGRCRRPWNRIIVCLKGSFLRRYPLMAVKEGGIQWSKAGGGKTSLLLPQANSGERTSTNWTTTEHSEITSGIFFVKIRIEEAINAHLSVYC